MIAIGNNELGEIAGDTVACPCCGQPRAVTFGERVNEDGTREPCNRIGFVTCGGKTYLATLNGRLVPAPRRDKG